MGALGEVDALYDLKSLLTMCDCFMNLTQICSYAILGTSIVVFMQWRWLLLYGVTVSRCDDKTDTLPLTFSKYRLKCSLSVYYCLPVCFCLFSPRSNSLLQWFSSLSFSAVPPWKCRSDFPLPLYSPVNHTTTTSVSPPRIWKPVGCVMLYDPNSLQA